MNNISESNLIEDEDEDKKKRCSSCYRFPKAVYFIVIIELCERFNYYGMRAILILYLTQHLMMTEKGAVTLYHIFVSVCFITTILGSFLADNFFGKYKTLLGVCILYTVGSSLMSLTSIPAINLSGPIISLLLIALGTGGVKACVAPFGGDQIPSNKKILLGSFFSMFYFAINLGSLLSTILTPILRANVACNGSDDCYPLAFGIPALLMGVSLVILLAGRRFYIHAPVIENIYVRCVKCIVLSIKVWSRERKTNPRRELLDYASSEYDVSFIKDMRIIYKIAILYLPLPIYWALFEQMGSRWTLQAATLDGEIGSKFTILPDQMNILNVILIMMLIPIFDGCIYPISYKLSPKSRPLSRMVIGMAITAISFLAAFGLQTCIEAKEPTAIAQLNSRLVLSNSLPCEVTLRTSDGRFLSVGNYRSSELSLDLLSGIQRVQVLFAKCEGMKNPSDINENIILTAAMVNFAIPEIDNTSKILLRVIADFHAPNSKGHPLIRLAAPMTAMDKYNFVLKEASTGATQEAFNIDFKPPIYMSDWSVLPRPGRFLWTYRAYESPNLNTTSKWHVVLVAKDNTLQADSVKITSSQVSLSYMTFTNDRKSVILIPLMINRGAQISILWQIPQYVLISTGEILFSITGLSFSYDQAPEGMKSLVNALWFMTMAIGNIMVVIIANIHLVKKQSWEYFLFAVLCLFFNVIFAVLAYFYQMVVKEQPEQVTEVNSLSDID